MKKKVLSTKPGQNICLGLHQVILVPGWRPKLLSWKIYHLYHYIPKPGQHICLGLHPVILVPGNGGNQIEASRKKIFKMILLIGGPK